LAFVGAVKWGHVKIVRRLLAAGGIILEDLLEIGACMS